MLKMETASTYAQLEDHSSHGAVLRDTDHVRFLREHRTVVVDIRDHDAEGQRGPPRVHRAVRGLNHNVVLAPQLSVQRHFGVDAAVSSYRKQVGVIHDPVADSTINACVRVSCLRGWDEANTRL